MFIHTEQGERLLWHLKEVDAQKIAKELVDRELTVKELENVQRGLDKGFENCWYEILDEAVRLAVEESKYRKAVGINDQKNS